MSNYNRSTYRNNKAAENITLKDTLIDPYYSRHEGGTAPVDILMAFVIGVVMGLVLLPVVRSCDKEPEPVAAQRDCIECHKPPVITGYQHYKRFHQRPNNADKLRAKELENQEQMLARLLEAP